MKRIITAIVGIALLAVSGAYADSMKVGLIDLPHILQKSPQVAEINQQLQAQFKPRQEEIVGIQSKIRAEAQQLSPDQASKLKPEEKEAIQKKISADQKNLQQLVISFQQDVSAAQEKAMTKFMDELNTEVKTVAQKDQLDLVLLKPAVVYADNYQDITQQVLDALPKSD